MSNLTIEQKAALYDLIRPEIRKLAHQMEIKFRLHDDDRGNPFDCRDNSFIDRRIHEENAEFYREIKSGSQPSRIWGECADCCNFYLMRTLSHEHEWRERASRRSS